MSKRIILAGGSGFMGNLLHRHLENDAHEVLVLTRNADTASRPGFVHWDGESLGPWQQHLDGARAVINLAGRSVNCRYHDRNRRDILASRIRSTRVLGEAIAACKVPPPVWLNASTATIYKHTFGRAMDEHTGVIAATPEARDAFSIEVATAWEKTFDEADTPKTRKVALRTGIVMAAGRGGVFHVLRRLTRFGLGGKMASGRQYVSWIHGLDFCRAVTFLIEDDTISGPINISSPHPVTNGEMMADLRREMGMPFGLPAARWMLEIGAVLLRTETELILKSRRVVPARLLEAGFEFRYPDFTSAVREILAGRTTPAKSGRKEGRAVSSSGSAV